MWQQHSTLQSQLALRCCWTGHRCVHRALLCASPFLISTSPTGGTARSLCDRHRSVWFCPAENKSTRYLKWAVSIQLSDLHKCIPWLILWHRWTVFNTQLNFERSFIFPILCNVFWWPSTVLFALQINCYIVHLSSQLIRVYDIRPT